MTDDVFPMAGGRFSVPGARGGPRDYRIYSSKPSMKTPSRVRSPLTAIRSLEPAGSPSSKSEQKARAGSMGRVLPERTAETDRYGAVNESKPGRMEGEKSERVDSTDEGGEVSPSDL